MNLTNIGKDHTLVRIAIMAIVLQLILSFIPTINIVEDDGDDIEGRLSAIDSLEMYATYLSEDEDDVKTWCVLGFLLVMVGLVAAVTNLLMSMRDQQDGDTIINLLFRSGAMFICVQISCLIINKLIVSELSRYETAELAFLGYVQILAPAVCYGIIWFFTEPGSEKITQSNSQRSEQTGNPGSNGSHNTICPNCGEEVSSKASFCPKCYSTIKKS